MAMASGSPEKSLVSQLSGDDQPILEVLELTQDEVGARPNAEVVVEVDMSLASLIPYLVWAHSEVRHFAQAKLGQTN